MQAAFEAYSVKICIFLCRIFRVLTFLQKYHIIHIENFDELMSWLGLLFAVLTVYRFIIVIGAMPTFPKSRNGLS